MVRSAVLLLAFPGLLLAGDPVERPEFRQELRLELLGMEAEDQRYRRPGNQDTSKADAINTAHLRRLKQIVAEVGWPGISMVGEDGAQAAWLLVQHADQDRAYQREILALIEPLVAVGEVSPETFAYLYDRVNLPQRYGTQGECKAAGQWVPYAIEDEGGVDSRRAAIGMEPLARYAALVSTYLCVER